MPHHNVQNHFRATAGKVKKNLQYLTKGKDMEEDCQQNTSSKLGSAYRKVSLPPPRGRHAPSSGDFRFQSAIITVKSADNSSMARVGREVTTEN